VGTDVTGQLVALAPIAIPVTRNAIGERVRTTSGQGDQVIHLIAQRMVMVCVVVDGLATVVARRLTPLEVTPVLISGCGVALDHSQNTSYLLVSFIIG
jgi:hypothetical protein